MERVFSKKSPTEKELIEQAKEARNNAYAPYSNFKVGASVLTSSGKIFKGANVENASYGLTVCAERVAVFKAVSSGEKKIKKVAVVTNSKEPSVPCGACLQVLSEFGKEVEIIWVNLKGKIKKYQLRELLPKHFKFVRKSKIQKIYK